MAVRRSGVILPFRVGVDGFFVDKDRKEAEEVAVTWRYGSKAVHAKQQTRRRVLPVSDDTMRYVGYELL
jgi:hypothetical protein